MNNPTPSQLLERPIHSDAIRDFLNNGDTRYGELSVLNGASPLVIAHLIFADRADRNLRRYLSGCNYAMFALLDELNGLIAYHPPLAKLLIRFVFEKLEKDIIRLEFYELMLGMYGLEEAKEIVESRLTTPAKL
ncbi:hypothetical protein GO755_40395 [Spirosoma sp. HMF4905]|uniref:Uncharacterized protein n=1 Tax=Spirosoma arboris TaxID=2682092 RepID=A0A7K1SRK0_9BACT|nr:hypothetical protein [Spirosoma arboris]MVM36333.1 hypothetical protein [Spirosoma arboris]